MTEARTTLCWSSFVGLLTCVQIGCTLIHMSIDGIQIPAYMIDMITNYMTDLIKGGMEANVETLHYAVAMANQDVQGIGTQMLAGNFRTNASEIRDAIAAEVYGDLNAKVAVAA